MRDRHWVALALCGLAAATAGCRGGILTRASSYDKLLDFPADGQPLNIDRIVAQFPELKGVVIRVEDYLEELERLGPEEVKRASEYRIEPDVTIRVTVVDEASLSGNYVIGPNGYIDFPLVREVPVVGRTLHEVSADIEERLRQFLKNPQVLVNLDRRGQFDSRIGAGSITLMGVGVGGASLEGIGNQVDFIGNQTLIKTIGGAGLSEGADWRAVRVIRKVPGQRYRSRIIICDLWKYIALGDLRQDLPLRSGDVVYIPQKWTVGDQFAKDWSLMLGYMSGIENVESFRKFVKATFPH